MTNNQTLMDLPSTFRSLYWPVAIILALLLGLLWLMGYGPGGSACKAPMVAAAPLVVPAAPVVAPAPVVPPAPVVAPAPVAAVAAPAPVAAPPAAKLYFDTNKFDVKAAEQEKTKPIIEYLLANASAKGVLSGFHDPRGNKAANEELAFNRARAVRSVLEGAGIAKDRIVMAKPVETTGDGNLPEARRVELSVQP